MAEFRNVKIIGTGAGADAKSTTAAVDAGTDYTQLNVLNLGALFVNSLSGGVLASLTTAVASAGTTGIGSFGGTLSANALSASMFLKVALDTGVIYAIPLLKAQ